jgi:signal peptidase
MGESFLKRVIKISSGLVTTLLSLILLFMIFAVVSSKLSGGEPNILGYQLKTVLSGSMEPTFKTGSIIAMKPLEKTSNLKKGDVIAFLKDSNTLVTHRVIDVRENNNQVMYVTKGDNNEEADSEAVVAQNVVGVYTGITIPYLGYIIDFSKTNKGLAILAIIPGVLLILYSGIIIFKALKEIEQTTTEKMPL